MQLLQEICAGGGRSPPGIHADGMEMVGWLSFINTGLMWLSLPDTVTQITCYTRKLCDGAGMQNSSAHLVLHAAGAVPSVDPSRHEGSTPSLENASFPHLHKVAI